MKLRELREARGLTQKAAAQELHVQPQTLCGWEKGTRRPSADVLPAIADLYGVSVDALYGRDLKKEVHYAQEIYGPQADR